jgi:hypothetical protein
MLLAKVLAKVFVPVGVATTCCIVYTVSRSPRQFATRYTKNCNGMAQCVPSPTLNRARSNEQPSISTERVLMLKGDETDMQWVFTSGALKRTVDNLRIEAPRGLTAKLFVAKPILVNEPSGAFEGNDTVRSEGTGAFPDRLVDAEPLQIQPKKSATIWVDLETSSSIATGNHEVLLRWRETNAEKSQTIKIVVLNSTFPTEPTFGNLAVVWNPDSKETLDLLVEHRLSPNSSYSKPYEPKRAIKYWGTKIWSNANISSESMDSPPSDQKLNSRLSTIPNGSIPINYTADEIDGKRQLFSQVKAWGKKLQSKGVKNLVVMTPDEELLQSPLPVDVFVSMPRSFIESPQKIQKARQAGAETWVYTATNQDPFSPKWLLDFAPANFRALCGVYAHQIGATGTVYWAVDKFTEAPLNDIAYRHPNGSPYHGDGILIYPHESKPGAVVASSRLKWIRDGIMDYELLSNTAKRLSNYVVQGPAQWSQNPKDWVRFNDELRRNYAVLFPSE